MGTHPRRFSLSLWIRTAVALLLIGLAWLTSDWWRPPLAKFIDPTLGEVTAGADEDAHDHGHGGGSDSLVLSPQARANIGLTPDRIVPVALDAFEKTVTIPAVVAERPGRTRLEIAAPMTGVVTAVAIRRGEHVESGQLLFRMRLTHEDLVRAQTEFLRTLGEVAVEQKEIDRLAEITNQGAIAGKVLLERQYEKQKLQAVLRANRQSLLLHGLSANQIASIEESGDLISEVEITVPYIHEDMSIHDPSESAFRDRRTDDVRPVGFPQEPGSGSDHARAARFAVADLAVHVGESVTVGRPLAILADYGELYIEGRAFEQDAEELLRAAENDWPVNAALETRLDGPRLVRDLDIVYLASEVDPESRTYPFYVGLPNDVVRTFERGDRRFVTWRYKPGQRVNLHVPVERWEGRIVVPVDAVADEGAESYVFVQNGDEFERRPVHVEYRGQHEAVIANDGSVFPGERIATTGAHQMQMAIKNAAGGGVDPHAGHNH